MADDPAFVWERPEGSLPGPPLRRTRPLPKRAPVAAPATKWVTLREAADVTGLPVSTLRNWARKGRVATRLEDRVEGPRRMVDLATVEARARVLGRIEEAPPQPLVPVSMADRPPEPPEGTMLVPLDAWEKMLSQLGNLHEAGQQLAEARERAAKAETEAAFLRERVADLRAERDELRDATASGPTEPVAAPAVPPAGLWTRLYRQWQRRNTP